MKTLILSIIFLCLMAPVALADTHTVATCSQANVQAAVDAASDGDTVAIPAGSCTWSSPVTVNLTSGGNRALTIQGAGIGSTIITNRGFLITGADGKAWRMTAMTLRGSSGFLVHGQSKTWRIDHVYFDSCTGVVEGDTRLVMIQATGSATAYTIGVIDHCTFYHPTDISVHSRGNNVSGGNADFERPLGLGGADAIYIEDCEFILASWADGPSCVNDCDGGAAFVFRHNRVTNGYVEMHDAIINGLRGCRKWEIYDNTFTNTDPNTYWGLHLRSGAGVAYNNTWNGKPAAPSPIEMTLYRTIPEKIGQPPWTTLCSLTSGKAILDTPSTYPQNCTSGTGCVNIDGSGTGGHPCRDQIGWYGGGTQTSAPALFWNNKYCTTYTCTPTTDVTPHLYSGSGYYTSGVDYCYASTTMPATCNGITQTYTPYQYPFPWTGESPPPGEDTTAPIISGVAPVGQQTCTTPDGNGGSYTGTLSAPTNEAATCKANNHTSVAYDSMALTMTGSGTSHTYALSKGCGETENYYVSCRDPSGNTSDPVLVTWSIAAEGGGDTNPPTMSGPLPNGGLGCTGGGSNRNVTIQVTAVDDVQPASGITVKYDTVASGHTTYDSMTGTMDTKVGDVQSKVVPLACNASYSYNFLASDGTNKGTVPTTASFSIGAAGLLNVSQAESGTLDGVYMTATEDAQANGGYYVSSNTANQGTDIITVNVASAGTYRIMAKAYGADNGEDSFFVSIDGGTEFFWNMGADSLWSQWKIMPVNNVGAAYSVYLTSGNHTITFRCREAGARLDYIYLEAVAGADTTKPVCYFGIPAGTTGPRVVPSWFTATDDVAVTGYLLNETATTPSLNDAGWSATPQSYWMVSGFGSVILYGWAKDAAGNISDSCSATSTVIPYYKILWKIN